MALARRVIDVLASYGLACVLILNLFLLTWFGTLYQVHGGLYEAQKLYFESWIVVQRTPVPLVLPGGLTCMGLLAVNLFLGGLVRIQKSRRTLGVIVIHCGIALLLASGFVKLYHSEDGHLTLYEGQQSDEFESYFLWEVAVWDASQKSDVREHLIPGDDFQDLVDGRTRTFRADDLPFEIELSGFLPNCRPLPKGPMWEADSPVIDGYGLKAMPFEKEAEMNFAGLVARFRARDGAAGERQDLLAAVENLPATYEAGGTTWAIALRHARYGMPFTIRLEDFRKEDHPGMNLARSFESDVTKIEGGNEQKVRIQMNEPLRHEGLVLFQASWGPSNAGPNDRLFSTFAVVRNPSDYWPAWACGVVGIGLLIAFAPKLYRFTRAQAKRAPLEVPS